MVAFEVGPSKKPFSVHLSLLLKASKFVEAAFRVDQDGDGVFKEANEKKMELPDETPETFRYFTHWLYSGTCPPFPAKTYKDCEGSFKKLVNMYVFGDRYDIAGLRYSTCLAIIDIMADPERHVSYQIPPIQITKSRNGCVGMGKDWEDFTCQEASRTSLRLQP